MPNFGRVEESSCFWISDSLSDVILFTLTNFEERRKAFNAIQVKSLSNHCSTPDGWNRIAELKTLAKLLVDVSRTCVEEDPNEDCSLVYDKAGLKVWKKEFGLGRLLIRAEFIAPVTPEQYCKYASDVKYRKIWDTNVAEVRNVESLGEGVDICYVATKRVGTIYPRDTVNLRSVGCLDLTNPSNGAYVSCCCSVEHPEISEQRGRVRADLRIGAYLAKPFPTPLGLWTKVYLFNEGDPRGWIPSTVTKMLASKIVPGAVERVVRSMLFHYGIVCDVPGCTTPMASAVQKLQQRVEQG